MCMQKTCLKSVDLVSVCEVDWNFRRNYAGDVACIDRCRLLDQACFLFVLCDCAIWSTKARLICTTSFNILHDFKMALLSNTKGEWGSGGGGGLAYLVSQRLCRQMAPKLKNVNKGNRQTEHSFTVISLDFFFLNTYNHPIIVETTLWTISGVADICCFNKPGLVLLMAMQQKFCLCWCFSP